MTTPDPRDPSESRLQSIRLAVTECRVCALCLTRTHAVPGEGPANAQVMFVGEAPGAVNDREGRPFVGRGGAIFDSILAAVGIERRAVYISNIVKCWPPGNRRPSRKEIQACHRHLADELETIRPAVVIALGRTAFTALTGQNIPFREIMGRSVRVGTAVVVPMYHPNGLRYIKGGRDTVVRALRQALGESGVLPWNAREEGEADRSHP